MLCPSPPPPIVGLLARQLRGSTPRDDVGSMNPVVVHSEPLLAVPGTGTGESPAVSGDAPLTLGGDVSLTKVP